MAKVVLLNSGGLDSAILAKYLSENLGHEVHSLHVDTDRINRVQTMAAAQTTADRYCASHKIVELKFGIIPNAWVANVARSEMDAATAAFYPTDPPVRMYEEFADPYAIYLQRPYQEFHAFPNRTMILTAIGTQYAFMIGATDIFTGTRFTQKQEYIDMVNEITQNTIVRMYRPRLHAPMRTAPSYRQVAAVLLGHDPTPAEANALRAEFAYTHSCRWPTPCGICEKCTGRAAIGM